MRGVYVSEVAKSNFDRQTRHERVSYLSHIHITLSWLSRHNDPLALYEPLATVSFLSDTSENPLCPLSCFPPTGGYICPPSSGPAPFHACPDVLFVWWGMKAEFSAETRLLRGKTSSLAIRGE